MYKDLNVWQRSVELAVRIYEITKEFAKEEIYGRTSQLKRSAVSVPSNIAEGAGRNTANDFRNLLGISYGSSCELDTQRIIANKINLVDDHTLSLLQQDLTDIQKMNWSLRSTLLKN
jgi:four helix bundle protein